MAETGGKKNLVGRIAGGIVAIAILSIGGYLVYDAREKAAAEVATAKKVADEAVAKAVIFEKEKADAVARAEAAKKVAEDAARKKELAANILKEEVAALKKKVAETGGGGNAPADDGYAALRAAGERAERALSAQVPAAMMADTHPLGRHPQDAAADADRQVVLNRLVPNLTLGAGWYWGRLRTTGNLNVNHNVQAPDMRDPHIPIHLAPTPKPTPNPGCPGCGGGGGGPPPIATGPVPPAPSWPSVDNTSPAPSPGRGPGVSPAPPPK